VAFKLDPESEVNYRVRLAQRYLLDAEDAYKRGDYRGVVASSQLVAENAAKAVIAVIGYRAGRTILHTSS